MPTLNKSTRIPPLNSLRFIPANKSLPTGYNTFPFDTGFFYQHIREFYQTPTNYFQKITNTDQITIYADSLATTINILLLDPQSNTLATLVSGLAYTDSLVGNVDSYFGDQYYTFIYQFFAGDVIPSDGFYYVLIQAVYPGDADPLTDTMFVTECLQMKYGGWPKTMLFEYSNDENDYDVLWEPASTPQPWAFRAEAILNIAPGGHTVAFQNLFWKNEKLQDIRYRVATLFVGGDGIPDWIWEKLDFILACDTFTINGERWFKEPGANWTVKESDNFPMKSLSIKLMNDPSVSGWEYNNAGPSTFRFHDDYHDDSFD